MIQKKKKKLHMIFLYNVTNVFKCCKKNGLNCYCDVIKDYESLIKFENKLISNINNVFVIL